ncbi:DUF4062 domain-containing protein [Morganella morganii]|uniref:DUF4062 domain-containing protein n=1 Tax=Morganella morganii TaxID=582 RepID=UPI002DEFA428|nr:DUF4062 domain-containing protein [Morganella morganii]
MDKRYQVFVSSTFTDLQEERQNVIQALMEMDCIPAGMELFPAADEEQWEFIKKIINDCDYYLLIIGGRYGSLANDGISYTEKEFDYAVSQGIKIVALIHEDPENLVVSKSETDPIKLEKLNKFKEKVKTGRMVKFWKTTSELPGMMSLSLNKTMKMYPAIGWVRANQVASNELLTEINQLRKENSTLKLKIQENSTIELIDLNELTDLDSTLTINGEYSYIPSRSVDRVYYNFTHTTSWRKLFSLISPYLLKHPNDQNIKSIVSENIYKLSTSYRNDASPVIDDQQFQTIKIQFEAYELIKLHYNNTIGGGMALFWSLTEKGRRFMIENRVIRNKK